MFKKKKTDHLILSRSENVNLNHFDDDPFLNVDPVFSNEAPAILPNGEKFSFEKSSKEISDKEASSKIAQLSAMRKVNNPSISENSPLFNVIGAAKNRNVDMQQKLIENDPVIAKLAKIEELRRTGGSGEEFKADLSKSQNAFGYSARAKEFNQKNNVRAMDYYMARIRKLKENENMEGKTNTFQISRKDIMDKTMSIINENTKSKKSEKIAELEFKIQEKIKILEEYKKSLLEKETNKHLKELEKLTSNSKKTIKTGILDNPEATLTKLDLKLDKEIAKFKLK